MNEPDWAPESADTTRSNVARVYDTLLGGTHNFAADRDLARAIRAVEPHVATIARMNRAYLIRAARFLAEDAGIDQFLDIGSGIPSEDNVHDVAQRANPEARVVYVDNDPVAVAHTKAMLTDNYLAAAIRADLRRPGEILAHPTVRNLLDFDRPVAVVLTSVLHFITDEDNPPAIVARLRDAVPPGSYLVISHGTDEDRPGTAKAAAKVCGRAAPATPRSRQQILGLFAGWELVEPGLVYLPEWRPSSPDEACDHPEWCMMLACVGRKR
ncbi:MAG: hypothetical protein GEV03_29230 [Streptosporangiales bacterium]|nr:hypothetical protein [Streptosporangiales bacterium]